MQHRARPGGDWRKLLPPQRPVQAAAAAQRRRQQQWLRLLWLRQQQWLPAAAAASAAGSCGVSGRSSTGGCGGSSSGGTRRQPFLAAPRPASLPRQLAALRVSVFQLDSPQSISFSYIHDMYMTYTHPICTGVHESCMYTTANPLPAPPDPSPSLSPC